MIQLEEPLYEMLKNRAFETRQSLSALIRQTLAKAFRVKPRKKKLRISQFKFIGMGHSGLRDVAERHDDYIAEAIYEEMHKK